MPAVVCTVTVIVDGETLAEFPLTRRLEGLAGFSGESTSVYTSAASDVPQSSLGASTIGAGMIQARESVVTIMKSAVEDVLLNPGGMLCEMNCNTFPISLKSTPTAKVTTLLAGSSGAL